MDNLDRIGVVIIGRNEGERLHNCFRSITISFNNVVYVDSGSTDNSVILAKSFGALIVELDTSIPFSAGRARNAGFSLLIKSRPRLKFVQFIDGDCQLFKGWLTVACKFLTNSCEYAIVAGKRKEAHPEKSIYNLLCDIEWNTPVGEASACGGDFFCRIESFREVGGFNPSVVAGEEPELCYRLRLNGWKIYRLCHDMTLHDAAMTKFAQWWMRSVRSGHAYAQGFDMYGKGSERYNFRECSKIWLWALVIPLLITTLIFVRSKFFLFMLLLYGIQAIRIHLTLKNKIPNARHRFIYAISMVIVKFPELIGQLIYIRKKLLGQTLTIIEYQ